MEGLGNALGAGVHIEVEGKSYIIAPMRLSGYAEIEQHVLNLLHPINRIKPALDGLPDDERLQLLNRAYEDMREFPIVADDLAVSSFIASVQGTKYTAWLCLRENHPDLTMQQAADVVERFCGQFESQQEGMREFIRLRDQASGLQVGNSDGPTQVASAAKGRRGGE